MQTSERSSINKSELATKQLLPIQVVDLLRIMAIRPEVKQLRGCECAWIWRQSCRQKHILYLPTAPSLSRSPSLSAPVCKTMKPVNTKYWHFQNLRGSNRFRTYRTLGTYTSGFYFLSDGDKAVVLCFVNITITRPIPATVRVFTVQSIWNAASSLLQETSNTHTHKKNKHFARGDVQG